MEGVRGNESSAIVAKQTNGRRPPEHKKDSVMKTSPSTTGKSRSTLTSSFVRSTAALLLLAATITLRAEPGNDNRAPEVPATLQVPAGNKPSFHAYAVGVQLYLWTINPTNAALGSWVFKAPEAVLFDANANIVGIHYAGPTWESNSGSKVVGARVAGVTRDAGAIPWLLLRATTADGPGIFARTTYIQRVNTVGGLAPATPGTVAGQEARVPYTAEYFFYRAQ